MRQNWKISEKEINKAKENGKSIIEYKNAQIDMEDALFLADCAAQQLKAPSKPFNAESVDNKKVLIIEENAEELGFAVKERVIERGEKIYPFHQSISSRMLFTKRTSKRRCCMATAFI